MITKHKAAHLAQLHSPGIIGYRKRRTGKHRHQQLNARDNGTRKLYKEALHAVRKDLDYSFSDLLRALPAGLYLRSADIAAAYDSIQLARKGEYLEAELPLIQYLER